MKVKTNDIVMVPKGYHPVVAGHGYNCYYLNFLAGSDQSLANTPTRSMSGFLIPGKEKIQEYQW